MDSFKKYLSEEKHTIKAASPSVHLSNLEDGVFEHGHPGVETAANFLDDAHNFLSGKKAAHEYLIKHTGHPVIFGQHPHTGDFFVSSRLDPKVNFSKRDVVNNHGGDKETSKKLMAALTHLPKIMPKNSKAGDVFQGEILHTPDMVSTEGGFHSFTPHEMTYSAEKNSPHGSAAKTARLGISVHTKYDKEGIAYPLDKKTHEKFLQHPHVHNISPFLEPDPKNYTPQEMKEFLFHKDAATKTYRGMSPESLSAVVPHAHELHKHTGQSKGEEPATAETFANYLHQGHSKQADGIQNERHRKTTVSKHADKVSHVLANSDDINKALKLHHHIKAAKNVLAGVMGKSSPWKHSSKGKDTGPEGVVAINHGTGQSVAFKK